MNMPTCDKISFSFTIFSRALSVNEKYEYCLTVRISHRTQTVFMSKCTSLYIISVTA